MRDMVSQGQAREAAIGWVIRLRDASAEDWEAFTAWLEADPAHLGAYEEAEIADREAEELRLPEPEPERAPAAAPVRAAPGFGRRAFLGWGIAASLALVAGFSVLSQGGRPYAVETAPGQRQTVELADGSRIELNGATRVMLDKDRPRFAALERGEALFHVVHDPKSPFEVDAGGAVLRDLGTEFNVLKDGRVLEVSVSEGAVLYNPGREAARLRPGMVLRAMPMEPLWIGKLDRDSIGLWREGRLVYSAATVSRVAADLSRNLGVDVAATDEVARRPFSGVIMLEGAPGDVLARASALLGLELVRSNGGWLLTTRPGARI
jgi:transmembrane sensor